MPGGRPGVSLPYSPPLVPTFGRTGRHREPRLVGTVNTGKPGHSNQSPGAVTSHWGVVRDTQTQRHRETETHTDTHRGGLGVVL